MIDGMIGGKLFGKPVERTAQSGKTFVTCKALAPDSDGEGQFIDVVTFDDGVKAALLVLDDGDPVALAGALMPKVWTDRSGDAKPALDMVAHGMLTAYHVKHERHAAQAGDANRPPPNSADGAARGGDSGMQNDL